MAWLHEKTMEKLATLDKVDATYCIGLAARFQKMGLSKNVVSGAIDSLMENEAIPNKSVTCVTPSLLKQHLGLGVAEVA